MQMSAAESFKITIVERTSMAPSQSFPRGNADGRLTDLVQTRHDRNQGLRCTKARSLSTCQEISSMSAWVRERCHHVPEREDLPVLHSVAEALKADLSGVENYDQFPRTHQKRLEHRRRRTRA